MTQPTISCDVLIEAGYVVPIIPEACVLEQHAVAITNGKIVAVLPINEAQQQFSPKQTVKRPNAVVMPGLVNAHAHNPMSLLRGIADDLPLMVWLQQHIWPVEAAVIGTDFVADGVTFAIAEMLRGGTTCVNENYFFPDIQAQTYKKFGFRAVVGLPVIDFPTAWAKTDEEYFSRGKTVYSEWKEDALVSIAFAPHAPYTVSDKNFLRINELSHEWHIPIHLHTHETLQEVNDSIQLHGKRPIARLDSLGIVDSRLIAVHMTQLTEAEVALCAERKVSVVHCPESNLKLASGFCPIGALHNAGVNIAIGTDGCASNNDLDMWSETRSAALLAKAVANDATALNATQALYAATMGGAKALGLSEKIGSLEVGKAADIIAVDISNLESQPLFNVLSQLIYASNRHQVTDVWIDGKAKLVQRELVDMDLPALIANARLWQQRIVNR